jgi:alpha-L-rhamnosidase
MRKKITLLLGGCCLFFVVQAQPSILNLRTENLVNPIGLDNGKPRFSWQLRNDVRNLKQTDYEVTVFTAKGNKNTVWHSGWQHSDQSVWIRYQGPALSSGKKYFWTVSVKDNQGRTLRGDTAFFQTGMLQTADWKAQWIEPGYTEDSIFRPSPLLRKSFSVSKKIISATAYITAHGLYEAEINGKRVGDAYLTPGWTVYPKRLQYQVYDVTALLNKGSNAIGVTLGSGWYRGYIAFSRQHNFYGKDIALLCQLDIVYADGSKESVVSDGSWKSSTGAIRYSEIYHGETVDARLDKKGWTLASYNDADWYPVKVSSFSKENLTATYNEPVRKKETFAPVKIFKTPAGEQVIDFGQNLVGWVELKASGAAGGRIIVSHAEVLEKNGNFYTTNLRAAHAQDTFYLSGNGTEIFEPHFTWHGFRYARIEGYPGELKAENIKAVSLYSDMAVTGSFRSSNALVNQLQHNIQWGQRGNFLDVPTDCPQRDERLGWTGDAQAFSRTAAYNMDVHNFFYKWLKDVEADQLENGSVPFVIPNVLGQSSAGSAGWADVANIVPWNMYLAYGDKEILENQYSSMQRWVGYMEKQSKNDLWNTGFHFGDWLFYRPDDDNSGRAAVTDKYLIAQCFFAHSTQLLINAAKVLGKTGDAAKYEDLLRRIKAAFMKEYTTASGRLVSSTQTAYVLALQFDMLPESMRKQAAERLVENIQSYNKHLTTGFLGTPYLCHVLTRFGYNDLAYTLLLQEQYPSWLYPVKMGATTIWERWDGIKPDGTFQTPGMNSYNHYAYGAIGDWMYRVMVGLDTDESDPGYHTSVIKPHIGGGFTEADAALETPYGKIRSAWKKQGDGWILDVEIPANTKSSIYLPASSAQQVSENGKPLINTAELKLIGEKDGYILVEAGSGQYHFEIRKK